MPTAKAKEPYAEFRTRDTDGCTLHVQLTDGDDDGEFSVISIQREKCGKMRRFGTPFFTHDFDEARAKFGQSILKVLPYVTWIRR